MSATAGDYLSALIHLLPRGDAWPRPPGNTLRGVLTGFAASIFRVDQRATGLIDEGDPRTTADLLLEWERATGLPDPCVTEAQNPAQRRRSVVARLRSTGGANAAYFIGVCADLGYEGVTVDEFDMHVWRLNIADNTTVTYFRAGQGVAGDQLVDTASQVIECYIDRIKPAHSRVIYNYGAA